MAHDFTAASSHSINYGDIADVTGNKLTIALWVYATSWGTTGQFRGLVNKRDAYNSNNAYSFGTNYEGNATWHYQMGNAAGTNVGANYTAVRDEAAGQWLHVCAVYDGSAATRGKIYVNGAAKTVTNLIDADVSPANTTADLVLGRANSSGSAYFDGRMANVGIWDGALTEGEVKALHFGMSPITVRPALLLFASDLVRGKGDAISGVVGTGSTAVIEHPRIIRRRTQVWVPQVVAGGGGGATFARITGNRFALAGSGGLAA